MIESVNDINKTLALFHFDSTGGFGSMKKFLHLRGVLVVIVLVKTFFDELKTLSFSTKLDFKLKDE
jgi:hypothetical protein